MRKYSKNIITLALVSSVAFSAFIIGGEASANSRYSKPSVEVHLEVLQTLRHDRYAESAIPNVSKRYLQPLQDNKVPRRDVIVQPRRSNVILQPRAVPYGNANRVVNVPNSSRQVYPIIQQRYNNLRDHKVVGKHEHVKKSDNLFDGIVDYFDDPKKIDEKIRPTPIKPEIVALPEVIPEVRKPALRKKLLVNKRRHVIKQPIIEKDLSEDSFLSVLDQVRVDGGVPKVTDATKHDNTVIVSQPGSKKIKEIITMQVLPSMKTKPNYRKTVKPVISKPSIISAPIKKQSVRKPYIAKPIIKKSAVTKPSLPPKVLAPVTYPPVELKVPKKEKLETETAEQNIDKLPVVIDKQEELDVSYKSNDDFPSLNDVEKAPSLDETLRQIPKTPDDWISSDKPVNEKKFSIFESLPEKSSASEKVVASPVKQKPNIVVSKEYEPKPNIISSQKDTVEKDNIFNELIKKENEEDNKKQEVAAPEPVSKAIVALPTGKDVAVPLKDDLSLEEPKLVLPEPVNVKEQVGSDKVQQESEKVVSQVNVVSEMPELVDIIPEPVESVVPDLLLPDSLPVDSEVANLEITNADKTFLDKASALDDKKQIAGNIEKINPIVEAEPEYPQDPPVPGVVSPLPDILDVPELPVSVPEVLDSTPSLPDVVSPLPDVLEAPELPIPPVPPIVDAVQSVPDVFVPSEVINKTGDSGDSLFPGITKVFKGALKDKAPEIVAPIPAPLTLEPVEAILPPDLDGIKENKPSTPLDGILNGEVVKKITNEVNPYPQPNIDIKSPPAVVNKVEVASLPVKVENVKQNSDQSAYIKVLYGHDETDIPSQSKADLLSIAQKAKDSGKRIIISSFASGEDGENKAANMVSLSRGLSLRAFFIDNEIAMDRIIVQAKGMENNGGEADRADITLK